MKRSSFDTIVETFEKIDSVSGRNDKLSALVSLASKPAVNTLTREILTYLLNPYWTYGVRIDESQFIISRKGYKFDDESHKYWPAFKALLDQLKAREITGNSAREAVQVILDSMNARYSIFLSRLLNRDMACGVQWSTYEKVFPNLVRVISPQLCTKLNLKKLKPGPYRVEPKMDGFRLHIIAYEDGGFSAISRNGKPSHNCDHIFEAIKGSRMDRGYVIDAEEFSGSWAKTAALKSTTNKEVDKKSIYCFDMIPLEDWEAQHCAQPLFARRRNLEHWFRNLRSAESGEEHIRLMESHVVDTISQAEVHVKEFLSRGIQGIEGGVIKLVFGTYDFDRTDSWMKLKPTDTTTFTVIGYKPGTKGKQHEDRCGAIEIEGEFQGVRIRSWMGQGLSNAQRDTMTALYREHQLYGSKIDVEFQGSTDKVLADKNEDGTYAVRNGVFKGFREDLE